MFPTTIPPIQLEVNGVTISTSELAELQEMAQKQLDLATICDLSKIKERPDDGRAYIYIKRKQYIANSRKELINKLHVAFFGERNITLHTYFEQWLLWRRDTGSNPKTVQEFMNLWKRFLKGSNLATLPVKNIELIHLEDFFLEITRDYAINTKCLSNVKSMLNLMFKRAVSLKLIVHNPISDIDYYEFKKRCTPSKENKENYTNEERHAILAYLAQPKDMYEVAIAFSFYLCLRIGELLAIKWEDVDGNLLHLQRSTRVFHELRDDLTFGPVIRETQNRMKNNRKEGFRDLPLTQRACEMLALARTLNPNGDYVFMHHEKQLLGDTFNERLKKICMTLNINYHSSHQIRFTIATYLYESGIKLTELSTLLGHSNTATTLHYILQKKPDLQSLECMRTLLE